MIRFILLLFGAFYTAVSLYAAESWASKGPAAFRDHGIELLNNALPGYRFTKVDELSVRGEDPKGRSIGDISFDRIYHFCLLNEAAEDRAISDFTSRMIDVIRDRDKPIEKSMIRVVVRPIHYIKDALARMGPGKKPLLYRMISEHLAEVPVVDRPTSWKMVSEEDCETLKLSETEVFTVGEQNLRQAIGPIAALKIPKDGQIGTAMDEYASSRILLHDDWKTVADRFHANLVVMAPASDVLLFMDGTSRQARDAMHAIGMRAARQSQKPISPLLLKWTTGGWQEVDI